MSSRKRLPDDATCARGCLATEYIAAVPSPAIAIDPAARGPAAAQPFHPPSHEGVGMTRENGPLSPAAARPPAAVPVQAHARFWRYGLSGAVATGVHYALLTALVAGAWAQPGPASAFAAGVGALVAYLLNRRYTFGAVAPHRRALPRFLLAATLGAAGNGLIVGGVSAAWGWHYLAAQALATVTILFLTFQLNRRWAFADL